MERRIGAEHVAGEKRGVCWVERGQNREGERHAGGTVQQPESTAALSSQRPCSKTSCSSLPSHRRYVFLNGDIPSQ